MNRIAVATLALLAVLGIVALAGCDIPTPPPEFPTATPGSQNPENDASRFGLTPLRPTPERGLTPLPVEPGSIYFVRGDNLWRISPDGSGEHQLSDLLVSAAPVPSPNGTLVAFLSGRDLYVVPSTGGEARKIASGDMVEWQRLGWSSDSALIGYITYDPSTVGSEQAWAVPTEGGEPGLLTTIAPAVPARGPTYERSVEWSPDGKWVVVSSAVNPFRLMRWPLLGGREGDVRDLPGGEIDWTPDSRFILFTEALNGALALYNVLTNETEPFRNEQALVGTGLGEYAQGPRPRWSPASAGASSDLIAYCSRTEEGAPQVAIRRRGGRELAPLDDMTSNPSWAPAGNRLVVELGYLEEAPLGKRWVPNGLAVADIDAEGDHTMTLLTEDARWPAWGK